ncbi:PLP-dependent transferase [Pluteus cervinus]|uniref:PLP-dependent transferase n=1 Tax=Pluteus cervinus TaxID=181527 RepID=A0ACD3BBK6_9AGAR|nr:PLP-dependent transferase [Pluteus cervinus]
MPHHYQRPISNQEIKWYKDPPPEFGHPMLRFFEFDPEYVNLNHGSFGALPRPVQAAYDALSTQIEQNPDYFFRIVYHPLLNDLRARLAKIVNIETDECVMIPNVAHGINTILRNFDWHTDDILVSMNTAYDSIQHAVSYLAKLSVHPTHSQVILTFPASHSAILRQFRSHLEDLSSTRTGSSRIVVVLDSIASQPGVYMPWREMIKICNTVGAYSIVDAAHSIGQETDIDLKAADPDFWVSNCNKWLYSKRGSAMLYVPFRNQHMIKDTVVPALVYPVPGLTVTPFVARFYWNGSADAALALSVDAALDFRKYLGGETRINEYCRALALEGGRRLAEILGTQVMDSPEIPGELTLNMVNVELPVNSKSSGSIYFLLQDELLVRSKVYATIFSHNGRWWARCSTQIYNEMSDFERLGEVLKGACAQL